MSAEAMTDREQTLWEEYLSDMANQTGFGHPSCYGMSRRDFTGFKDYRIALESFEAELVRRQTSRLKTAIDFALSILRPLQSNPIPSVLSIREAIAILERY